jgi:hypothetical protein
MDHPACDISLMRYLGALALVAVVSSAVTALAAACSSSDENAKPSGDGGGDGSNNGDGNAQDAGTVPDADGLGKLSTGYIRGITLDDVALIEDKGANAFYAVPVTAAGTPVVLVQLCPGTDSTVQYGARAMTCVTTGGAFYVWTAQNGPVKQANTASASLGAVNDVVDPQVKFVVYATNVVAGTPPTGDIVVKGVAANAAQKTLATGVKLNAQVEVHWAGEFLVLATPQIALGDAATGIDVASYDSQKDFTKVPLATGALDMTTTSNSTVVALLAAGNVIETVPVTGGLATTYDTNVTHFDMVDDRTVVWGTTVGALKRVDSLSDAGPSTLVEAGIVDRGIPMTGFDPRGQQGYAPNGSRFVVVTDPPITFALTVTGGAAAPPAVLPSIAVTAGADVSTLLQGDMFSADGNFFLYNTAGTPPTSNAAPTAGGTPLPIEPGTSRALKWALGGPRIAYSTDTEIHQLDLTDPNSPKVVVTGVAPSAFFLTSARNKVVYTKGSGTDDPGAFVDVQLVPNAFNVKQP